MRHINRMKKISALVLALLLALSLFGCGAQAPEQPESLPAEPQSAAAAESAPEAAPESAAQDDFFDLDAVEKEEIDSEKYEEKDITVRRDQNGNVVLSDGTQTGQDGYLTDPVPEGQQLPEDNQQINTGVVLTCYLSIDCSTILYNPDDLAEGKDILVPEDGVLFPQTAVTFYEGESVFDVLQRVTRDNRIHMSSRFTPMYNSAYIEAIGNLYEFDCGADSGWMYNVNGWYPNYGASRYIVQDGDVIQWNYTCDLGRDLGTDADQR